MRSRNRATKFVAELLADPVYMYPKIDACAPGFKSTVWINYIYKVYLVNGATRTS